MRRAQHLPGATTYESGPARAVYHDDAVTDVLEYLFLQDKLAAEIRNLNEKVGKWTYLVEADKVDKLTTDRAEVVKKKEAEVEEETEKED